MSRPIGTPLELERRRRHAVELLRHGESPTQVAHFLGVDRSSLYRWRQRAEHGPQALAAQPHPHRPPLLSPAQVAQLETLLAQGAAAHGWPNALWTTQRVADLIHRHFAIRYHHDHVGRFLRQRLGWTPQKPRRVARERDEAAILDWQAEQFPQIADAAQQRGAHLVFLDESGFMLNPCVRRTWAPRGHTPVLDAWDRRDKLSAISCITVSPVRARPDLHFAVLSHNAHAEDVVAFLAALHRRLGPLTVIWDRNQIHSKAKAVKAWLAKHSGVVAEDFPGYVPDLNPDEGVWGWTKYGRLSNLAAENLDVLWDNVVEELIEIRCRPDLLKAFIRQTHLPGLQRAA